MLKFGKKDTKSLNGWRATPNTTVGVAIAILF